MKLVVKNKNKQFSFLSSDNTHLLHVSTQMEDIQMKNQLYTEKSQIQGQGETEVVMKKHK